MDHAEQPASSGIAEAILIAEEFVGENPVILVLGDNIIFGRYDFLRSAVADEGDHAIVFAYQVEDPSAYGVIEFGEDGKVLSLEEKPQKPRSMWAVPGISSPPWQVATAESRPAIRSGSAVAPIPATSGRVSRVRRAA